jgi:hypothetical protein
MTLPLAGHFLRLVPLIGALVLSACASLAPPPASGPGVASTPGAVGETTPALRALEAAEAALNHGNPTASV